MYTVTFYCAAGGINKVKHFPTWIEAIAYMATYRVKPKRRYPSVMWELKRIEG